MRVRGVLVRQPLGRTKRRLAPMASEVGRDPLRTRETESRAAGVGVGMK